MERLCSANPYLDVTSSVSAWSWFSWLLLVLVFSADRASVSWSSFYDSGGGVSRPHAGLFSVCLLANESM